MKRFAFVVGVGPIRVLEEVVSAEHVGFVVTPVGFIVWRAGSAIQRISKNQLWHKLIHSPEGHITEEDVCPQSAKC